MAKSHNSARESTLETPSELEDHTAQYGFQFRLDRYLGFLPMLAIVSTLQASWQTVAASLLGALYNGGPVDLVYGFILTYLGTLALAASFAEMASIRPVAGAQYYWSADFAPFAPAFWGLIQGWITVIAWLATASLGPFFASSLIQGLVVLNFPSYVPQRWHATLMMWATLVVPVLANVYGRKLLKPIELAGAMFHLVGWIAVIATLLACVPARDRNPTEFVFNTFISGLSGWKSNGVVFSLGLITCSSALSAFDGALHLSEEVTHPNTFVPRAIFWGLAFNGLLVFGFILTALYTMGDYKTTLLQPSGFPIIEIFYNATKSHVATTLLVLILIITAFLALFGALASVSRLVWAFSRDYGLPFSRFLAQVDPKLRIPLRSLFLVVIVIILLSLIQIGSTTAFNALLSLTTLALYMSYIIPVMFVAIKRTRRQHIPWGPFQLGTLGLPINLFAIVYGIYIIIFLPFPSTIPVTAMNMNYSGPVLGGVLLFALVDWSFNGRHRWAGPGSGKSVEEIGLK